MGGQRKWRDGEQTFKKEGENKSENEIIEGGGGGKKWSAGF